MSFSSLFQANSLISVPANPWRWLNAGKKLCEEHASCQGVRQRVLEGRDSLSFGRAALNESVVLIFRLPAASLHEAGSAEDIDLMLFWPFPAGSHYTVLWVF